MPAQGWLERIGRVHKAAMATHRRDSYDVLIVGAGVIGLACAWRAARAGLRVCLLEREGIAAGASGVAAGMLAPVGEASWGEEDLLALNLRSLRLWDGFASELEAEGGAPPGYRRCGALYVALDRDEAEVLHRRLELHARLELDSEWLRASQCRRLESGLATTVTGGVHAPQEAAAEPRRLCDALEAALRGADGRVELGAEVVGARFGAEVALRTADGREFRGTDLVVASGCWAGQAEWLPSEWRPPVRPVKGELLVLREPRGEAVCGRIVASERVYLVPRADGQLVVGATVEERGFDTTVTAGGVHELLREAYRLLPEVAELELEEARAGLRPGSPDNAPLIGRVAEEGPILAAGHYRNGVLQAPVTAEAVLAALEGAEPPQEVRPFAASRFASPAATPREVASR